MLKLQLHNFLTKFKKIFFNFLLIYFFLQLSLKADQDKMILGLKIFNEKEVDELIVLDIDATIEGRDPDFEMIRN